MNNIMKRVSVRNYLDKEVEKEKIELLLKAAMQAPSAGNQQAWHFYVITNQEVRTALSTCQKYAAPCSRAPLVIVPCFRTNGIFPEYAIEDLSAAIENILLEAVDLDLGGVWMGIYPREDLVEKVSQVLKCPEEIIPAALIAIGYPAGQTPAKERYDCQKVTYIE